MDSPAPLFVPNQVVNWPLIESVHPRSPLLLGVWRKFLDECNQLSVQVRKVEISVIRDNVFITAEVERVGESYGPVFWHGYADETDSWGNGRDSDGEDMPEEDRSVASTGSAYSDRGQDKVGWFQVVASVKENNSMPVPKIHVFTGVVEDHEPYNEVGFAYGGALVGASGGQCLECILRQPGPGTLAYEWMGTQNPRWH